MSDTQLICATWIMAVATVVVALVAIVSTYVGTYYTRKAIGQQQNNFDRQIAEYQLALSADTTLKFVARFEEIHFKKIRSKGAEALLNKRNEEEAEDIFDFFDTVWLFISLGALTNEIAYSVFFHWINLYWKAGKYHIGSRQQDTASVWKGFETLYNNVCEIEKRNHPDSEDLKMPPERLRGQLQEEIYLIE